MSNGVNFRQLALDLRSELTKCQRLNAELLEALEEIAKMVEYDDSIAYETAMNAIAKARGEA